MYYFLTEPCENSISSPGQEEVSSGASFLDIPASVLSKLNLTAEKSSSKDNETASCPSFPSGMMSALLAGLNGEGKLTSYAVDSPAKTLAPLEKGKALPESEADCGTRWPVSLAKLDPDTHSWKIAQCSLLGDWESSLEIWPKWGMMLNGECWELATPTHHINGKESGFWPTPTCMNGAMRAETNWQERNSASLASAAKYWNTPMARDYKGHTNNPKNRGFAGTLPDQVKEIEGGGQLNPEWVEWLMGWPVGWTDLKPLAMDKFQVWLDSHGGF